MSNEVEVDVRGKGFASRVTLTQAITLLKDKADPAQLEVVSIREVTQLASRVLVEPVVALVDVPSFDRSAVDGYAVRAEDTFGASDSNPKLLTIIDSVPVRTTTSRKLSEGEAIAITTGGVLPKGSTAVVKVEDTNPFQGSTTKVHLFSSLVPGKNVSGQGEDFRRGQVVFPKGHILRPADLGVLSAIGAHDVRVAKKPSVGIFSTGNEVVDDAVDLQVGQIYDINKYTTSEYAHALGWTVKTYPVVKDDPHLLEAHLLQAVEENDFVVVSGGSAVGDLDLVPVTVDKLGTMVVHGIHIRPGSPAGAGVVRGKYVFALPGFPVASIVGMLFFVAPVVMQWLGASSFMYLTTRATLKNNVASKLGRRDFLRVRFEDSDEGQRIAVPISVSGSSIMHSITASDGVVVIDERSEGFKAGTEVLVQLIPYLAKNVPLQGVGSHE